MTDTPASTHNIMRSRPMKNLIGKSVQQCLNSGGNLAIGPEGNVVCHNFCM
jgi:hypothetical protein